MQIAFTWCFPVLKICSRKVLPRNHRSSMREKCWCDFLDRLVCGVPCGKAFKYQTEQPQPLGHPGGDLGKNAPGQVAASGHFSIHLRPLASTRCSCGHWCSHLQPLAHSSHLQPLAAIAGKIVKLHVDNFPVPSAGEC